MAISDEQQKRRVVLFLGSGFSAVLGLPQSKDLGEMLLRFPDDTRAPKDLEDFISAQICNFWKTVFNWSPGDRPPTLEDHFTQIDMAANSGHYLGPAYDPRKLRAIRRMTIHRILTWLKSQGIQDVHVLEFFKTLNEAFEVTVVTTNWDTEAEWCLDLLKISFNDGLDEVTITKMQAPSCGLPVLKLHGCINRGYCDCCKSLIRFEGIEDAVIRLRLLLDEGDFELFEGGKELAVRLRKKTERSTYDAMRVCSGCGVRLTLRIATFSFRKDFIAHAFYSIWDKAQTGLQSAEKWLFVGYSLPEADIEIRQLLKSAQLARRDSSKLSIGVVLKQDCEAGERYKRFFGLSDDEVFQDGLEEWITNHLKLYCR